MPKTKRKRGGQKGNHNAVKHGFYSREFNKAEQFDFNLAAGLEGIDEEITLLRFQIKKAVSGGDVKNLVPLVKAAIALEKLIRTRHKFFMEKQHGLKAALENVIRNVLVPFGTESVDSLLRYHYQVAPAPGTALNKSQKTNNMENEADLTYNQKQISEAN
jgi:hypothetical protein